MTAARPRRSFRRVGGPLVALALAASILPPLVSAQAAADPVAPDPASSLFVPLPQFSAATTAKPRVRPTQYAAHRVDVAGVERVLADAPDLASVEAGTAEPVRFALPDPSGELQEFAVVENSVMAPALSRRHPEIRTFAGTGITDPTQSIRLDVTPMGFHASVRSPGAGRAWYVDPAENLEGTRTHLTYFGSSVAEREGFFVERDAGDTAEIVAAAPQPEQAAGPSVIRRTYRLALVSDPSYATYFGSSNVTAEKVTLMQRVNQIYNDDLGIELELVAGTDRLNLDTVTKATGANGPCGANGCYTEAQISTCSSSTLTRNAFVIGQLIGADRYDIGHIALGNNGGGIAGLGVVGGSRKAAGCTGLPFPKGDFFAIDYVAHEIGHQFGGNHTFNGTQRNCSGTNRNAGTSVEPGSGSSVMAYAGICGQDDLQPHTDPYFSQRSIDEVTAVTLRTPSLLDEVQTVTLNGFDADGDSVTLKYTDPGTGAVRQQTVVRGNSTYNLLRLSDQMRTLTGHTVRVGGYDGAPAPVDGGFTLTFSVPEDGGGVDLPRLEVAAVNGATASIGVQTNGGEGTNAGHVITTSANRKPVTVAPAAKTLPIRTPFTLTGSATDADGDELIHLWEQSNAGATTGTALVSNTKANGPLFRVFGTSADVSLEDSLKSPSPGQNLADGSPSRTFPDLEQILAGNTNAATGACPAAPADTNEKVPAAIVDCYSEFLPTADYGSTMTFRLTTRDRSLIAGGTSFATVVLTLDKAAGPFLVTSRSTPGPRAVGGSTETVTWAVNGTNKPTLAENVRITLSTDGGLTYPRVLAASTPNDGSQAVTIPNVATEKARIRIEAVDNYFFDVNDADFAIDVTPELNVSQPADQRVQYSDDFGSAVTVQASSAMVDGDLLEASISGVPGLGVTRTSASAPGVRPGTATFRISGPVTAAPGALVASLEVRETGGSELVRTRSFAVAVLAEDATVAYEGDRTVQTFEDSASVSLSTTVTDASDNAAGDITTATVDFVDRDTDEVLCSAPVTGGPTSGVATCEVELASGDEGASYTVGTVVGGHYTRDAAVDDVTVVVTRGEPVDETAPETTITEGPREGRFSLKRRERFSYVSSEPGSTFECTLDGRPVPCDGRGITLRKLRTGTHVFTVAARDAAGNVDPTPATRAYAQPFTSNQLKRSPGDWRRGHDNASYRRDYVTTTTTGATLSRRVTNPARVALVVGTRPRQGRVAVYFRGQLLRKVSLSSSTTRGKRILPIRVIDGTRSGRITIKTLNGRPVRIEGLAVFSRPSAQAD
ncbi:M12 family metallo-peptidase [Nocardioides sp.]|uniref:M12 family metallo-peptidase n=1 Tax=Nocardioides sp. TaxID=35761 RepID=UPI003564A45F